MINSQLVVTSQRNTQIFQIAYVQIIVAVCFYQAVNLRKKFVCKLKHSQSFKWQIIVVFDDWCSDYILMKRFLIFQVGIPK